MQLLSAKPVNDALFPTFKKRAAILAEKLGRSPRLDVILVGEDPASQIYVRNKVETCKKLGLLGETHQFTASASPHEIFEHVQALNHQANVDGILVQTPLPKNFKREETLKWVVPHKDVDGIHPEQVGLRELGLKCLVACTPLGIMKLLEHYHLEVGGKLAVVIGRSPTVGSPLRCLLTQKNATVLQTHSKTPDLKSFTRLADFVFVAAGKPQAFDGSYFKKGSVVIDVGIHKNPAGGLVGDVDFASAKNIVSSITPVPGGVGPMTVAMVIHNTLQAAEDRHHHG